MTTATAPINGHVKQLVRHKVRVGLPGPRAEVEVLLAWEQATYEHLPTRTKSAQVYGNFDLLLIEAMNAFEAGEATHFAMLHSDTLTAPGWLDIILAEMDKFDLGLCSVPAAIKDQRGLMSSGIGDPKNPWNPWRRITSREMQNLPETFTAEDFGYPGEILLHNNGCWCMDLRKPEWFKTDAEKNLIAHFAFPTKVYRCPHTKKWTFAGESEDWYFSRRVHELGIKSAITRKVVLRHRGTIDYPNNEPFGIYEHDENTRDNWDTKP